MHIGLKGMIGAALAMVLAACSGDAQNTAPTPAQTVIVEPAQAVLQGEGGIGPRRFVGRVASVSTVDISFRVGGKIVTLPIAEGEIAPAGDLIAELDKSDFELALREAQVAFDLARSDVRRKRELAQRGNVSAAVLEQAEAEFRLREVALDNARLNLSYTSITAPFDALITRRLVEAQTNVAAGTPVLRIQDVSEVRIEISVPEDLLRGARDPEAFRVEAIATGIEGSEYVFPLEFRENNTEPDPRTQTYTVTFGMPRPELPNLLPGMSVTVSITPMNATSQGLVSVPLTAILSRADGSSIVWVYDPESETVSERIVEIGPIVQERIVVRSGLAVGERVVAAGADRIRDGMSVRLMRDAEQ